jgi:hypothetical protein
VDLVCLARLPWLILQPSVASTVIFCEFPHEPLALLPQRFYREKLLAICVKEKFWNIAAYIHLIATVLKTQATTHLLPQIFFLFFVEIPSWMGFGPQLLVVSGHFGGNPFVDGILDHNLLLSRAISVGIPLWMGFWATTCCCLGPLLSRWNSGYHEAFLTNFFLFSRRNSGYHKAFLTNFFRFS